MKQRVTGKRTPAENEAISRKTDEMISLGYPPNQAVAIAFRMFRDGELSFVKEDRRTPEQMKQIRRQQELKMKGLYALFMLARKAF